MLQKSVTEKANGFRQLDGLELEAVSGGDVNFNIDTTLSDLAELVANGVSCLINLGCDDAREDAIDTAVLDAALDTNSSIDLVYQDGESKIFKIGNTPLYGVDSDGNGQFDGVFRDMGGSFRYVLSSGETGQTTLSDFDKWLSTLIEGTDANGGLGNTWQSFGAGA